MATINWTGESADIREFDSSGVEKGVVVGGFLNGKTVTRETDKYNCGAWSEWVTVEGCTGRWCNAMNGCWQMGHQREEGNSFSDEVSAALVELGVI